VLDCLKSHRESRVTVGARCDVLFALFECGQVLQRDALFGWFCQLEVTQHPNCPADYIFVDTLGVADFFNFVSQRNGKA
jgi:hypothetical protein